MTFTGGAADHQHAHGEKAGKFFANGFNQSADTAWNSFHQILLHQKERLNAAHLAGQIAQDQVFVFKIIGQRFLDDFVEAMVFAAVVKGAGPVFVLPKLVGRDGDSSAVFKRKCRHLSRAVRHYTLRGLFGLLHFHAHNSVAEMQIALRARNFDAGLAQLSRDREIQFAPEPATPATSTRSPIVIGRSARMTRPLMKLLAMFCNPKPIPTPTAPAKTASVPR